MAHTVWVGDCLEKLRTMDDETVDCCITSPPYYGLRNYGGEGRWWGGIIDCDHVKGDIHTHQRRSNDKGSAGRKQTTNKGSGNRDTPSEHCYCIKCNSWFGQLGLEPTPEDFVANLVEIFREVRRVLKPTGTFWLNIGDTYWGGKGKSGMKDAKYQAKRTNSLNKAHHNATGGKGITRPQDGKHSTIKPKDLMMLPHRLAIALQDDGWWVRNDIVWCLSGGTELYVKNGDREFPITIKDLYRMNKDDIQLWNGEKWTNVVGMSKTARQGNEIRFRLRSGERISCTPNHKFPTNRGLLEAKDIKKGDVLIVTTLPEPKNPLRPKNITNDLAWFVGLYLAEGSKSGNAIQIAGHSKEIDRWDRLTKIAYDYGGTITRTIDGNKMDIRMYGKLLHAIIDDFVAGKIAKDKHFAKKCWRYDNEFLKELLNGYLAGDGHYDKKNNRWRLGFTRNYYLESDLRTICARLGYSLTLSPTFVTGFGKRWPSFRGEIRIQQSKHGNVKDRMEILGITNSSGRNFYDIGVEDEPHLFSLASGVLTHNSKPNPMPESVRDRCGRAHEYIFLLTKSKKYHFDYEAIKEPTTDGKGLRTKRDVWTITNKPFKGAHFATYPPDLIEPCILAGCPSDGVVLDPFAGSGTTGAVAEYLGRDSIQIELMPEYAKLIPKRIEDVKRYFDKQKV